MPYTLLTAATLGFDLVRRRGGDLVAQLLLTGLTADADLLHRLAAAHSRSSSAGLSRYAVAARRAREAAAATPQLHALATLPADAAPGVWASTLQRTTLGTVDHVERLLRMEVLGPDHPAAHRLDVAVRERAAEVLANAVIAAWGRDHLPPTAFAEVLGPYRAATGGGAPDLPELGPGGHRLTIALSQLLEHRERVVARWRTRGAAGGLRPDGWVDAMHDACWATHLAGRTRTVAAAHLLAVQVFQSAHLGPPTDRGNLWNLLAGFTQATAVADLLEQTACNTLTRPWRLLVG